MQSEMPTAERLKSLDLEFRNEVKQLTVVQVSYGYVDDLWPAQFQFSPVLELSVLQ